MPLKKPPNLGLQIAPPLEKKDSFHISETGTFTQDDLMFGANGISGRNSGHNSNNSSAPPVQINFEEIKLGELLGEGVSSKVYQAVHKCENSLARLKNRTWLQHQKGSGIQLAVKVLRDEPGSSRESRHMMLNEVKLVFSAQSDHLVKFYDAFFHQGHVHMAFEWMDLGSLEVLFQLVARAHIKLEEQIMAQIIVQMSQGLAYLHKERHAVHRDLKPANVLVNSHGCVKLSDFGISKELGSTQGFAGTQCGTATYMSPERITGKPYSYPADIWSLGLMILEGMCNGYPYQTIAGMFDLHQHIVEGPLPTERPEVQQMLPKDLLELTTLTLQKDPACRIEVLSILRAPFILRHQATTQSDLGQYFKAIRAA